MPDLLPNAVIAAKALVAIFAVCGVVGAECEGTQKKGGIVG